MARILLLAILLLCALGDAAWAQLGALVNASGQHQVARNQPVTFTADSVEYDR